MKLKTKFTSLLAIPIVASALLAGCQQGEQKTTEIKNDTALVNKVSNDQINVLGESFKNYADLKKMLDKNALVSGNNTVDQLFFTGIYSAYSTTADKNKLNNYLLQTKVDLESQGKKYTPKIKNEITYNFVLQYGLLKFLNESFPVSTEDLGNSDMSSLGIQFVTYELTEDEMKEEKLTTESVLNAMKKDLKKVNKISDMNKIPSKYNLYNYTKANPLLQKEDWDAVYNNRNKKFFSYKKDNIYHFIKVVGEEKLSTDEKSAIISLNKFDTFAGSVQGYQIPLMFIKTLDSFSDDFDLTNDVYKELENQAKNLSDKDMESIIRLLRNVYVENYVVVY